MTTGTESPGPGGRADVSSSSSTAGDIASSSTSISTSTNHEPTKRPNLAKKPAPAKTPLKILMLHGFTQSGALFNIKTRAIEKFLVKTLAPLGIEPQFLFPTGPVQLSASEVPGYTPPAGREADDGAIEAYAWFTLQEAGERSVYRSINEGARAVAQAIRDAGGIDAVCGFSQGGCMASVVAAALEGEREVPEELKAEREWVEDLRQANGGRGLKFAVVYSGFKAKVSHLAWCYEPAIRTPTLQFIGSLDTVVDEQRSRALVDRCIDPVVLVHPGGHHVPVAKQWVIPLAGFIKQHHAGRAQDAKDGE